MRIEIEPERNQWKLLLERPVEDSAIIYPKVQEVIDAVKQNGDQALVELTKKFDRIDLIDFKVPSDLCSKELSKLDSELRSALEVAKGNIEKFHAAYQETSHKVETQPGVFCWRKSLPLDSVGLYVPGGTAPLISTALMLGVPAKLAACKEIVLCSPPQADGLPSRSILAVAALLNINQVYALGGAQAIAALAYGTESVPKVDKIFGPGNQYVTAAKELVANSGVMIDMPAGPSELLVYADQSCKPEYVAADLLSQAEHGIDSQVVLVVSNATIIDEVRSCIDRQVQELPRRDIAEKALENSVCVKFEDYNLAFDFVNAYAPEHLVIASDQANDYADLVRHAGSVFLGHYTPESAGDYASGTNHVLPTNGFARLYSGVSVDSFVKKTTFQELSQMALKNLGPAIECLAIAEGLEGHAQAVRERLKDD